jgi:hypothetical protein
MINIRLLLTIVVIYCVLFLLFGFIIDLFSYYISYGMHNIYYVYDELYDKAVSNIRSDIVNHIFFIIFNCFILYRLINRHKISVLELYIYGFIIFLIFSFTNIRKTIEHKLKPNQDKDKYESIPYYDDYILIFNISMMFLNGAIYATIAKLAYYYKLAE